ncbi:olfactory receptor 6C3-like [Microcaecilia unicolor]|uniref:Olfactory receptor 6C3-like n=1 Tax=Microcaecilia unicolor TaxID=1415580 RepID=A0A6P7YPI5_9AMPH|nr:olfactory receptor 6C3-like [Microcaecilia unicolor]
MGEIEKMNHTKVTEFIILGFFELPEMQPLLFLVFLIIYLMSFTGNLLIIFTVCSNSQLHSPMFFFLSNLSFLEICYVTVTVPKLLAVLIAQNKTISFMQCMMQMYLFLACTVTEFHILTAMAYDRYVAICKPLHYTIIMNRKVCIILAIVSWIIAFLDLVPQVTLISQSSFCSSNEINHFFCDFTALMTLSCSETYVIETINYIEGPLVGFTPFILTVISYVYIISAVLKIHSATSRQKTFSTCSSHLIVVLLFYGTSIVCSDSHLHSPMFFFLSNLSFLEICYVTVTVPKLLAVLIAQNKTISFMQCMMQMYLFLACTRNLLIIFTVCSDSHLHSPMFFFLINLSFLEICYVTVTVPKLLAVLIAQNKTISFMQCMIQMYLFLPVQMLSSTFSPPWPMIAMLPSAILCVTPSS